MTLTDRGATQAARYVLIDLPSAHEIEDRLATECEFLAAILANHGLRDETRHIKAASRERFIKETSGAAPQSRFVHLAGHGDEDGLEVLGATIPWSEVARRLKVLAPAKYSGKRYLTLSCCYSSVACTQIRSLLRGHFNGIYHFKSKDVGFANAMAIYAMFYMSKIEDSATGVRDRVNDFFGEEVLIFHKVKK